MANKSIQLPDDWKFHLSSFLESTDFIKISSALKSEKALGKIIFPPGNLLFNAFNTTPLKEIKVVIIGQDPYHGYGQAMGLSFSVPKNIPVPASLKNIFKEIERSLGIPKPTHGDLTYWAKQGVFLLNSILSVEANQAASHRSIGWEKFTDEVIKIISNETENVVFLLWGNYAKQKKLLIDASKHLILEAVHPSPLAGNGFQGSNHFKTANQWLESKKLTQIDWQLPE